MTQRLEQLDRSYEFGLILLGILSASELQYFLTVDPESVFLYALRVFTMPFIFLIAFWLIKEIFSDVTGRTVRMLFTDFCWSLWSFTLFYYLLALLGGYQISVYALFAFSMLLFSCVLWAYERAFAEEEGTSVRERVKRLSWILIARYIVFVGAYLLLLSIVLPLPAAS